MKSGPWNLARRVFLERTLDSISSNIDSPVPVKYVGHGLHINVPYLMPDELCYSYFRRLADINSMSYSNLLDGLGFRVVHYKRPSYNMVRYYNDIDSSFSIDTNASFFDATSLSHYYGLGVLSLLGNDRLEKILAYMNSGDDMVFRYCPECRKADIEKYGVFYIHRSHCVPLVCRCHIHGARLIDYIIPVDNKDNTCTEYKENGNAKVNESTLKRRKLYKAITDNSDPFLWPTEESVDRPFGFEYAVHVLSLLSTGII